MLKNEEQPSPSNHTMDANQPYESWVEDPHEFHSFLIAIITDEQLVGFYDYLVQEQKKCLDIEELQPRLVKIEALLAQIIDYPVIQEHVQVDDPEERDRQIEETLRILQKKKEDKKLFNRIKKAIDFKKNNE